MNMGNMVKIVGMLMGMILIISVMGCPPPDEEMGKALLKSIFNLNCRSCSPQEGEGELPQEGELMEGEGESPQEGELMEGEGELPQEGEFVEGEGESPQEGELEGELTEDGELLITFIWPTEKQSENKADDFSTAKSLSLTVEGQTQTIDRPVTMASFEQLSPGEYFVTMTLYDGLGGAGKILSRGSVIVTIGSIGGTTLRLGSDQSMVQSLLVNASEEVVFVNSIAQITAIGLSIDQLVVLLPAWAIQWTSVTPQYGGVSSTGLVTGMNPGIMTIRVSMTDTAIQKEIELPVEQLTLSFEPEPLEVPSNGSMNVKVLISHSLPQIPGTEFVLRWNSNGAWGALIDPATGLTEDWVETSVGAPQITAHANKRADLFKSGFACYLVRKWGPTTWDQRTIAILTSDVRVRGLTFSAPIILKDWEAGGNRYFGCGQEEYGSESYTCAIFLSPSSIPQDATEYRAVITTDNTHPTISNGAIIEGVSFVQLDDGTYVSDPICVTTHYYLHRNWGECLGPWNARMEAVYAETEPLLNGLVSALVEVVQ